MARDHLGESPFLKRILVPCWVIRDLVMVINIGLLSLILAFVVSHRNDPSSIISKYKSSNNVNISALIGYDP